MTTPEEILLVMCNCPDEACARELATGLIDARLAACVNLLPAVQSIYRWEGQIEAASETTLLIKTHRERWPELENWLASHHPYQVPEIIALPLAAGLSTYLDWVAQECRKDRQ